MATNSTNCDLGAQRYDVSTASCTETLQGLFNAYMAIMTGQRAVVVRFDDRWLEYNRANGDQLRTLYVTLFHQCPAAAAAGLPDLTIGGRAVRAGRF